VLRCVDFALVKVVGAGYTRTGTLSLTAALEALGIERCLHPLVAPADAAAVSARGEEGPAAWREALGDRQGALGWVGAHHYRELLEAWPDALVLLSVRDPEEWYASYASCIRAARELALAGGEQLEAAESAIVDGLMMVDGPVWKGLLDGSLVEREGALARYERHNNEVLANVPAERLLVYEVEQGWGPLCEFLGVAEPDLDFPHLNDRRAFRARFARRPGAARRPARRYSRQPRIGVLRVAPAARTFTQDEVLTALGMAGDPFAEGIFERCGVKRRALGMLERRGAATLQGRTHEAERDLFEQATATIDSLGIDLHEIDTVITSSIYTVGAPTLAHRLVEHYELAPTTDKYHVTGVGCASAVPLVRLMSQAIAANPARKGLVVAVESMSGMLTAAGEDDPRAKVIGSAIFGDGCAAAVIDASDGSDGPRIVASSVYQIPGTLDVVHMALADDESYLHLARELPEIAASGLAELIDGFLRPLGLTRYAIDHWAVHPGGRRILDCVQDALDLSDRHVESARNVLANRGNIGTPSIFYVLDELIATRRPAAGDRALAVTVGPGVTLGLMLLSW
jgi:predicted naringenin-chalcone synthase